MKIQFLIAVLLAARACASASEVKLALDSARDLTLVHVAAAPEVFRAKASLKLTADKPDPAPAPPAKGRASVAAAESARIDHLAIVKGTDFSSGTIEVDVCGVPASSAPGTARGFVGVAFRVQPDGRTYDCFYLRPTNGRADDQERRNHTAQYIHHPEYPWFVLREKFPSRYEAYADIQPDEWIHVRIEVDGSKARLFVNGAAQPTLIVNDLKSGATARGAVALWLEGSTVARFANLRVTGNAGAGK